MVKKFLSHLKTRSGSFFKSFRTNIQEQKKKPKSKRKAFLLGASTSLAIFGLALFSKPLISLAADLPKKKPDLPDILPVPGVPLFPRWFWRLLPWDSPWFPWDNEPEIPIPIIYDRPTPPPAGGLDQAGPPNLISGLAGLIRSAASETASYQFGVACGLLVAAGIFLARGK